MTVPHIKDRHKDNRTFITGLILLAAVLLIPALFPEKFGWLTSFVPLPIFYYLVTLGNRDGYTLIRNAVLLAAVGAFLIGSMPVLIFSLAMMPLGVFYSQSVLHNKNPVQTGFVGALLLALAWVLFWSGLGMIHQVNPYTVLLAQLDEGLASGLKLYEETADLPPQTMESIKSAVGLLRTYIPKVLPSLLVSAVLSISWLNLALGNWLLKKKNGFTVWPDYVEWQLPESLVWLVIASGIMVFLLPEPLKTIGLNVLIVCGTVYFFQGLAIVTSLLNRWSVPLLIRVLIYTLIFIQTYGIIILSFVGLADIWADFRKLKQTDATGNNPV